MATVFLAEDERLRRKVAVKRLHSDSPADAALRFQREAKVGAALSHPSLVTVFDTVADDEGVLIVMEYVAGENLAAVMEHERLPADRAVAIVADIADALDHAHSTGVIHRDVKPANVLVGPDGKAKLVDLGIATAAERTQITAAGTVLGTPSYMPPEQLDGGNLTKAVDVYALGAVAFELLSGRKARQGRTPFEIAAQIASGPPPNLLDAWPGAPPAAAAALERAMARDPADRQQSAGELARELQAAVGGLSAAGPVPFQRAPQTRAQPRPGMTIPVSVRPRTYRRGLPRWLPLAGLVLVALVVIGAIISLTRGDSPTAPVVDTTKKAPAHKHKSQPKQSQATPTQSQTTPAQPAGPAPKDPAQGVALHAQAHQLINQGQYDKAIQLEQQAIPMLDGSGRIEYWYALYDLGHALRLAGHPDQAIPILQKRLQNPDQRPVVQAELAKAEADAGK